ncbi:hypothetical protein LB823_03555 [Tsukamurella sp. M9C]|uniref:hypothetical protein n=1 Tax=Tsukamurella sp. M9C TaxID=2877520 RepID=UPI001CCAEDFB|nr:hypothetical protein [Tsukamurella sp. M9C]MCA0155272.1 hypothetical protein [Tsukamurella sp. M9C]
MGDEPDNERWTDGLWLLLIFLAFIAVIALGVKAWASGHKVGFSILVLAGCTLFGLERVAVAIRRKW